MILSLPVVIIQLLGGIVFVLSAYVIAEYVMTWVRHERDLLPLHVWVITVSYNCLVLSLMWRGPENDIAFFFGSVGLALGIYSLWVLGAHQRNRRNR